MPRYELIGPDGGRYEITAPDGIGEADVVSQFSAVVGNVKPTTPAPEPDAPTWWGRRMQDVRGRQDPRYKSLPTIEEVLLEENKNATFATPAQQQIKKGQVFTADDTAYGDVIESALKDRFVRRELDANGYEVVTYKDRAGKEARAYVNRPGFDGEDVGRFIMGSLPYMATGGAVGAVQRGAPLLRQAIGQGLAASGTSLGADLAAGDYGSKQAPNMERAVVTGGVAAAAPIVGSAIGTVWNRFVREPRYFNRSTGQLTPLGRERAKAYGLDPEQLTQDGAKRFAQTYAMTKPAAREDIGSDRFSFEDDLDFNMRVPSTVGQRTKDPSKLMREKGMRHGLYGENAKSIMQAFDEQQSNVVDRISRATIPAKFGKTASQAEPADIAARGAAIRSGLDDASRSAKMVENDAWSAVPDITPKREAYDLIPEVIGPRLGNMPFDDINTPSAFSMAEQLQAFMKGEAPTTELDSVVGLVRKPTVDGLRRQLLQISKNAQTPTDRAAAGAIYQGYNEWIEKAAERELLEGSVEAAASLRGARDISREINSIFRPNANGRPTPGGRMLEAVMEKGDTTPENIVNTLFAGPKAMAKEGTVEALRNIKRGLDRFAPGTAQNTWNDIRVAYWLKLVQGKDGNPLGNQMMLSNIKQAFGGQQSVVATLYTPQERAFVGRFIRQLEKITYKDPNPSGTATGLAVFGRQFLTKLLDAFGPLGRTAFEFSGVPRAWGTAVAKGATRDAPMGPQPDWMAGLGMRALQAPAAPVVVRSNETRR